MAQEIRPVPVLPYEGYLVGVDGAALPSGEYIFTLYTTPDATL